MWFQVFKNGPSKICGRQPLKILKWTISLQIFQRLSSTNFTLSILEYLDAYELNVEPIFPLCFLLVKYLKIKFGNFIVETIAFVVRCAIWYHFVQFKKREKHPWRSVNFSKVAGSSLLLLYMPIINILLYYPSTWMNLQIYAGMILYVNEMIYLTRVS